MSKLLASRFTSGPALIAPGMSQWANDCIEAVDAHAAKLSTEQMGELKSLMAKASDDDFWPEEGSFMSFFRPYTVKDGTLIVPVKGLLLHDLGVTFGNYVTGYTYIRKAFERGMADEDVKRIAMVVNSGGGEVAGNFDLVDALYNMRGTKPMVAFVNEHAYSAAMSLASAMDRINVPRTGGVGSIGVVTAHLDRSEAMEKAGLKVTFVHAGKHKVDGNAYGPMSDDVKNRMQARIDGLYNIFVSTVARNLGVSEQVIRDTEALTYSADEAHALGLAHQIGAYDEAMAAFSGASVKPEREVTVMSTGKENEAAAFTQADLDEARAEGKTEGEKAGATAERERIKGIMGCDESKNRAAMTSHLALNTQLSVEDAKGILGASPEQAAAPVASKQGDHFSAAMGSTQNPEVTPESTTEGVDTEFDPVAFVKQQKAK